MLDSDFYKVARIRCTGGFLGGESRGTMTKSDFGIYLFSVRINGSKEIISSVYLFFSGLYLTTFSFCDRLKCTVQILYRYLIDSI